MAKDPFQYFRIEARELLEKLSRGAMDLEKGKVDAGLIGDLLRQAHTLKGAARVVKQAEMAELAHAMEDVLSPHRDAGGPLPPAQAGRLLQLVDECEERLRPLLAPAEKAAEPSRSPPEEPFTSVRVDIAEMDTLLSELTEAGVHLRAFSAETASLDRIARTADQLLEKIEAFSGALPIDGRPASATEKFRALAEQIRTMARNGRRSLDARVEKSQRDFAALRERAGELRLLPVHAIGPYLERAARDSAESLGKRVGFEVEGGDNRLDSHVLLAVRDALQHVVRNAVAHGIETEAERAAAGKPARGHIRLSIRKLGQNVSFVVEDDGRGLDLVAIGRAAVANRLLTPPEAANLSASEAVRLLLRGGLTTSTRVSEVSGRGVGLEVVNSTAARLKGTVRLRGEPGRGLAVELVVPVSLECMTAVEVVVGDSHLFLPFASVARVSRLTGRDLARSPGGTSLILEEEAVPFQPLEAMMLGSPRSPRQGKRSGTAVVLQAGTARGAVGVDRVAGLRDVVVRPLPGLCGSIPLVAGAIMNEEGDPELLLDPFALVTALQAARQPAPVPPAPQRQPLLVVDDSLTTRMLEQSVLEAAGYQVDLATSGEEAIEKARAKRYAMFVVDVEMPGMNGFELLERFRSEPHCDGIPAIMVTSRAAPEDRLRGERAGARAYIVKSEFHEGSFLRTIRQLIGEDEIP